MTKGWTPTLTFSDGMSLPDKLRALSEVEPHWRKELPEWGAAFAALCAQDGASASFWFGYFEHINVATGLPLNSREEGDWWEAPILPCLPTGFSAPHYQLGLICSQAEGWPPNHKADGWPHFRNFVVVSQLREDRVDSLRPLLHERKAELTDVITTILARATDNPRSRHFLLSYIGFDWAMEIAGNDIQKVRSAALLWPEAFLTIAATLPTPIARDGLDAIL